MPRTEVAFVIRTLFGDEEGRASAARTDRRIDRLPGLARLALVTGAVDRYAGAPARGVPAASAA